MADAAFHTSQGAAMDEEPNFPVVIYVVVCAALTIVTATWWVLA